MFRNLAIEEKKIEKSLVARYRDVHAACKDRRGDNPIYRKIESDRIHTNFLRVIPATIMLIIVEVCGMIWSLIANPLFKHGMTFAFSCAAFILVSFVFIGAVERILKAPELNIEKKRIIYIVYWTIYMAEAMSFATMEFLDNKTANNYLVFLIVFTVLPVLEPAPKALFYTVAGAAELMIMLANDGDLQMVLICIASTFAAFAISYWRFYAYVGKKLDEKKLEFTANGDSLTLLSNRRGMQESVPLIQKYCKNNNLNLVVIMIDIDNFKKFNDKYGHVNGDLCLKTVAGTIHEYFIRPTDICVRYGGEEFCLFCAHKDPQMAVKHLIHFLEKIKNTDMGEDLERITVSIGVYAAGGDEISRPVQELIDEADKQLYNAKQSGKACVSFENKIYRNL